MLTILRDIDQTFLKETISGERFGEYFFSNCKDEAIAGYLKGVLG